MAVQLRVRRPEAPTDMLSTDAATEADVVVTDGGRVLYGDPGTTRLYNEDAVFLRSIIDALRHEVERLERALKCRKTTRTSRTRAT